MAGMGSCEGRCALPVMMPADRQYVSFLLLWHGLWHRRRGLDGLRRTVAQLQGVEMPVSDLERSILAARLHDDPPAQLDRLIDSREVVWQGSRQAGERDGVISLFLRRDFALLGRISVFVPGEREGRIRSLLANEELEFEQLLDRLGGFPDEILRSLWKLVWNGEATGSSLDALRARQSSVAPRYHRRPRPRYAARRRILPGAAGRWSLLSGPRAGFAPDSGRRLALARQLLDRYGIVSRDSLAAETVGVGDLWPLFERLEAEGCAHRTRLLPSGGPAQFAAPGAEELWRRCEAHSDAGVLSACDPANPFGVLVPWPVMTGDLRPQRTAGARVLIQDGALVAYLSRQGRRIHTPRDLVDPGPPILLLKRSAGLEPLFLESINGDAPYATPWHRHLVAAGFSPSRRGYLFKPVP